MAVIQLKSQLHCCTRTKRDARDHGGFFLFFLSVFCFCFGIFDRNTLSLRCEFASHHSGHHSLTRTNAKGSVEPDVSQNLSVHSLHYMDFLPRNKRADLQDMNCWFVHPAEGSVEPWMGRQEWRSNGKKSSQRLILQYRSVKAASEPLQ